MNFILIAFLSGSLITSIHDTREACEGRAVILREAKATDVQCVARSTPRTSLSTRSEGFSLCTTSGAMLSCRGQ